MASGLRTALVVAAGMTLLAAGAPAATAADEVAERGPMIGFVEGSPGTVEPGWTGPLVVAGFSTEDDFTYRLRVTGPEGYRHAERFVLDAGHSMREEVELPPAETVGDYRATLRDDDGSVDAVDFAVAGPTPGGLLRVDQAPPASFLPRVRDGIRDVARMRYSLSRPASVVGSVVDSSGRVVRRVDLGRPAPGAVHTWAWAGRVGGGLADRGTYRMRLTASDAGTSSTVGRTVRVASYRVPVDRRVDRAGMATSRRSPGGCTMTATEGRGLAVDCRDAGPRGGAVLRYWFATGDGPTRWKVTGDGTARRSAARAGRGTAVTLRVPAGSRWHTREVAAAWQARVLR